MVPTEKCVKSTSCVSLPYNLFHTGTVIQITRQNEEIVAEPIDVLSDCGIDFLGLRQFANTAFGTSADRPRHMGMGGVHTPSGQYKLPDSRSRGIQNIDPAFKRLYAFRQTRYGRKTGATGTRGEITSYIKKSILNLLQLR